MSKARKGKAPKRAYDRALVSTMESSSVAAEAYRMLRTNLLVGSPDVHTILMTSAGRGEGKSLTSANLGVVMAQSDRRVAIVDADLRIPSMHQVFNLPVTSSHIGTALQDPTDIDHVCSCMLQVADSLDVLPAGGFSPEFPSEILGSQQFSDLIETLRDEYDYVIIDTAPVGLVTDAVVASQFVDGVLFVIDHQTASRRFVQRSMSELQRAGRRVLGTVLNRYPVGNGERYVLGGDYYRAEGKPAKADKSSKHEQPQQIQTWDHAPVDRFDDDQVEHDVDEESADDRVIIRSHDE